jgi:6-pyruvoyltetrahydropterin/6-carboxytetrahydropterin synthase
MSAFPYFLTQRFHFDAAHTLRREIEAEASRRVHGHTYFCEVTVAGNVDPVTGMVVDLGHIRAEIAAVRDALDHHYLDEVPGVGIPTLENLCRYIYGALKPAITSLHTVRVWRESLGDGCVYTPDQNV